MVFVFFFLKKALLVSSPVHTIKRQTWTNNQIEVVKKYNSLPLLAWTVRSQEEYMRIVKHCDNIIFEGFLPEINK